ncbi:MAG: FAD-dependent oxidoreductase, partial [Candidatus Marinimicrobia bacterium]|nr:FAD-dependent oxidoreductase [Candidatus Neomarinimicrobiota bacterium]
GLEPDGERIITSREAMVLESVPERLVIVGAGAIGIEFAYLYNVFGSQVTVIEMLPALLPGADADISRELARQFKKRKIKALTGSRVESIVRQGDELLVQVSGTKEQTIIADVVLLAMGVTGNVENLGLEQAGVTIDKGAIKVDEYYRTAAPNILAIGDVIGPPWLAHVASAEGIVAVEQLAGLNPGTIDYGNIPLCTFCEPQVASVGLTEEQAEGEGYEIKVGKFPFRALGKAVAIGKIEGFAKVIYDAKYGKLLGAHLIGHGATDLISEVAVGRKVKATFTEIMKTVHPHPTLSEAVMEATALAYGESTNF